MLSYLRLTHSAHWQSNPKGLLYVQNQYTCFVNSWRSFCVQREAVSHMRQDRIPNESSNCVCVAIMHSVCLHCSKFTLLAKLLPSVHVFNICQLEGAARLKTTAICAAFLI